ncbi:MAG: lipopolysaccharide biosynthesis protein [Clostridia bacterium]|nr:lipopolysaccharide biosynthesis protein [Clostridia bacterium]
MVNLLFCGNDGVFDGILTCLLSIVKRSDSAEPYAVTVFTMDVRHLHPSYIPITDAHIELLQQAIRKYNPESTVRKRDVTPLYEDAFAGCPNESAYCSPYTLIRLFADQTDLPDKFLYLDADILLNRDIHLLYDRDLTGYEYAAARDHYGKYLIHPHYINAGVLLFNMEEARRTGLFEKARVWIRKKKLVFADQSALIRSTSRRKLLPQRFNDQKFLHKHTVIRHFSKRLFWFPYPHTDNVKQWQVDRVHAIFHYHQFDDILDEYLDWKHFETRSSSS